MRNQQLRIQGVSKIVLLPECTLAQIMLCNTTPKCLPPLLCSRSIPVMPLLSGCTCTSLSTLVPSFKAGVCSKLHVNLIQEQTSAMNLRARYCLAHCYFLVAIPLWCSHELTNCMYMMTSFPLLCSYYVTLHTFPSARASGTKSRRIISHLVRCNWPYMRTCMVT